MRNTEEVARTEKDIQPVGDGNKRKTASSGIVAASSQPMEVDLDDGAGDAPDGAGNAADDVEM